jgi:hypothetical protein
VALAALPTISPAAVISSTIADSLDQVADQLPEFGGEGFFRKPHRLIEAGGHAGSLLLEQLGVEPAEVVGRLDGGEFPCAAKKAFERWRIIRGVEQRTQTLLRAGLERLVVVTGYECRRSLVAALAESMINKHVSG